jgi:hypothetical protein
MPSWGLTSWQRSLVDACFFHCQAPRHLAMVYFFLTSIKKSYNFLQIISQIAGKKTQSSDKSIRARRICCSVSPRIWLDFFFIFVFPGGYCVRTGRILFGDVSPNFDLNNKYDIDLYNSESVCECVGLFYGAKFRPNAESVLGCDQRLFLVRNQFWGCDQCWAGITNTFRRHPSTSWTFQSDPIRVSPWMIPWLKIELSILTCVRTAL